MCICVYMIDVYTYVYIYIHIYIHISIGFLSILPIYVDHILHCTCSDAAFDTEIHHVTGDGENAGVVYCEMQVGGILRPEHEYS
jgi:hypothetical protein